MLSYCLKCRKNKKVRTPELQRQKTDEQCFHQTVRFVGLKNRDLSKSKKKTAAKHD